MRRVNVLQTLALGSALILALGGIGCANEEDSSDAGEPSSVEASSTAEAPEKAADDTSPPSEEPDALALEAPLAAADVHAVLLTRASP